MAKTEYDPFGDTIEKEEKPKPKPKEQSKEEYTRKTFMVNSKYADLINRKAFWERREIKDVLNEILEGYFKDKKIKEYPGE